jgi:mannose-1-phosphate guanylyltransferase/mannose-6-phosphate isomerase
MQVIPVIIAGGSGTRLWPLSTVNNPKLFLKVNNKFSLLQNTLMRAMAWNLDVKNVITVLNENIYHQVQAEYQDCSNNKINLEYIIESAPRNTAPAILAATLFAQSNYSADDILVILPADHIIANEEKFSEAITKAVQIAQSDYIVTLGIEPDYPETGYGYINIDRAEKVQSGYRVNRFVEKPDLDRAQQYLQSKDYLWNAGIFCVSVRLLLRAFADKQNNMYLQMLNVMSHSKHKDHHLVLDKETFSQVDKISIDYAIVEQVQNIAVVPCQDILWSDVGSWPSLSATINKDSKGNMVHSDDNINILYDVSNTVLYSTNKNKKVVVVGLEDLIIVDTDEALLVTHKDYVHKIKEILDL